MRQGAVTRRAPFLAAPSWPLTIMFRNVKVYISKLKLTSVGVGCPHCRRPRTLCAAPYRLRMLCAAEPAVRGALLAAEAATCGTSVSCARPRRTPPTGRGTSTRSGTAATATAPRAGAEAARQGATRQRRRRRTGRDSEAAVAPWPAGGAQPPRWEGQPTPRAAASAATAVPRSSRRGGLAPSSWRPGPRPSESDPRGLVSAE